MNQYLLSQPRRAWSYLLQNEAESKPFFYHLIYFHSSSLVVIKVNNIINMQEYYIIFCTSTSIIQRISFVEFGLLQIQTTTKLARS